MKIKFLFLLVMVFLQSCHVSVKREYQGLSGALVFTQNKKWLVNNLYSHLDSFEKERLNKKILEQFQVLSKGNATSVDQATSENLLPSKISFNPDLEQLESLKTNSDFDYLVNIRTIKVRDQIASLELSQPFEYSRNEAFALLEIYDLKSLKKIYSQKATSEVAMEGKRNNPDYYGQNGLPNTNSSKDKVPFLNYSARTLSVKNLNKILKDIDRKAIK
mgnify:CR=1 FL=1